MVDITEPTVGSPNWGPVLNTALTALESALTAAEGNISTLDSGKVAKAGDTLSGALNTTSTINVTAAATTTDSLTFRVSGDTQDRLVVNGDGRLDYGSGSTAADTSFQRASTAQLRITPSANASASSSVGGALNITNTASTGAGAVIYSEQAAPAGHLLVVRANNATFNQNGIFAQYTGTGHNINISHAGTGSNSSGLNVGSTNADHSAVGISGVETAKGTVKVTHTGTGADASASALSIDLAGTGTASQGIFMTGTNGGTTGNLLELRNGGTGPVYRVTSTGQIHLGSGTGSPDVILRRSAADELTIDDPVVMASTVTAGTGAVRLLPGGFTPQDHGLECWTHDPYFAASSAIAVNSRIYLVRLNIRRAVSVDTIHWVVGTAGATPTAGQNEVGLYDSAGTRLAATNVDASISSAGAKATAITAQALTAGTFVWVAFVFNAATPPTLLRGSSFESSPSLNLGVASGRAVVNGTGTVLPASITPASNTTSNCLTYFAALEAV